MNKKQVITNLFNDSDCVVLKNKKTLEDNKVTFIGFETKPSTAVVLNDYNYFCINPIDVNSNGAATNSNIITYRNFLIENDTLSKQEQLDIIKKSELPISNQIFSGNGSIHNTICLQDPLLNEEEYRVWFKAIVACLAKHGYVADNACINPSRLSRMPEAVHPNGNTQEIVYTGARVSQQQILDWLTHNEINLEDYRPKPYEWASTGQIDDANDEERWEAVKRIIASSDPIDYNDLVDGEREPRRFRITLTAKACGLSPEATFNYMVREFPSSEGDQKLRNGIERAWKRDVTPIQVTSKETWIKQQEAQAKEDYNKKFEALVINEYKFDAIEDEVIEADYDTELHRYMLIGNDIYMLVNRQLKPITMQRFTIHHPKAALRTVNRYVDFVNEPGYINFQPIINRHYNSFKLPTWHAKAGQWPTIEHYLRHIAGDQYEMMLDYLQISLIDPKQKLPILILLSYDKNTGKTTFLDLLTALFGENVATPTPKQFELEWNTHWVDSHFIFVDEAERLEKAEDVASKLKRLCYAKTAERIKKGKNTEYGPFNGRFVITSNQASGFIEIDEYDDRWWILNPPKRKGEFDPNYVDRIKDEVPYFAHFLMHRTLSTQNIGRGWFSPELLKTPALEAIIAINRPPIETDIKQFFEDWFNQHKDQKECNFLINRLADEMEKYNETELKEVLHKVYGVYQRGRVTKTDSFGDRKPAQKYWYTVNRNQVLSVDEINESLKDVFNV